MVLLMVMGMVARPLLQRAGCLDEHVAGEVSRETYGLVIAALLAILGVQSCVSLCPPLPH